jgi:hypothetical protein
MHRISGGSDNPAFFISGIRPDTGFDLPDIRMLKIAGYQFITFPKVSS